MNLRKLFCTHEFRETLNGPDGENLDAFYSSKNHRFKLYVSQGEHGVMIWTGVMMDFVCGTVGVLDIVKRNSPSYLWLP